MIVAAIARHLHQSINEIEFWEADKVFFYFDRLNELAEAENPPSDE